MDNVTGHTGIPEFSEGVCEDGAAILMDGQPIPIGDILSRLRRGAKAELQCSLTKVILRDIVEQAHMAGQADAGVDPGYSNARAYYDSLAGVYWLMGA